MTRPDPETMESGAVVRWLIEADERLANAEVTTLDRSVRDAIRSARRAVRPAVDRARRIHDDGRLRGARQQDLPLTQGPDR